MTSPSEERTYYDRRLVAAIGTTLLQTAGKLEATVTKLESEGWEIDPTVPDQNNTTFLQVFRAIRAGGLRGPVLIPMRKEIPPEELEKRQMEIEKAGTG